MWQTILINLLSTFGGVISSMFNLVGGVMKSGAQAAMKFNQEGVSAARELGLGVKQAQAYTQALAQSTADLANKYGVTAEAIKEVQRGISDATGRQLLLNQAETESFVIMNKLVGAQTTNAFTSEIMKHLGGQISTVEGAISKAYATAAKQGLNASKFSSEVAKNLTMANKLSFKNGIDGIIRMTALSERLGFNMQSIGNVADKFMNFDSAIESSAQLNMLGGAAGAYGSDPLTMMYEANYDPEALGERMTNMLKGLGTFDAKTGMGKVNGMNMDFARNIAKAMGISADEAVSIAKKQAEARFKESRFGNTTLARFNGDEEKRNYILNNSTYNTKTQQLELNGKSVDSLTEADIANMMQFDGLSDTELLQRQAEELVSVQEHIDGAASKVAAEFAIGINEHLPDIGNRIKDIGDFIGGFAREWGNSVGNGIKGILEFVNEYKEPIKKFASTLGDILSWIIKIAGEWPKTTLMLLVGWKMFGNGLLGKLGPKVAPKLAKGAWSLGKNLVKGGWNLGKNVARHGLNLGKNLVQGGKNIISTPLQYGKYVRGNYQALRSGGRGVLGSALKAMKAPKVLANGTIQNAATGKFMGNITSNAAKSTIAKSVMMGSKVLKGAGLGIVGAVGNVATDALVDNGKIERGGVAHQGLKAASTAAEYAGIGAMLGSAIPGVGNAVGAAAGAAIGAVKGAYDAWKSLPENADKDFIDYAKSVGESVWESGKQAVGWMGEKLGGAISSIGDAMKERGGVLQSTINLFLTPIRGLITFFEGIAKAILHPVDTIKGIWQSVQNFFNMTTAEKGKALLSKGADILFGEKKANGGIVGTGANTPISIPTEKYDVGGIVGTGAKTPISIPIEKHDVGGIVGGDSYTGDKVITGLNSGEMVLNKSQQSALFKLINTLPVMLSKTSVVGNVSHFAASNPFESNLTSILGRVFNSTSNVIATALNPFGGVKTKPFGDDAFNGVKQLMKDIGSTIVNGGKMDLSVKDININLNGTIKLDGGNSSTNLDVKQLLNDTSFVTALKELLKQSINSDINGGRFMNDTGTMRGLMPHMSTIGRI